MTGLIVCRRLSRLGSPFRPADVWEQTGAIGVLVRLAVLWSLIGIAEATALDLPRRERWHYSVEFSAGSEERARLSSFVRSGE